MNEWGDNERNVRAFLPHALTHGSSDRYPPSSPLRFGKPKLPAGRAAGRAASRAIRWCQRLKAVR